MAHKHEHKIIPAPYKVITQYENEFIKIFNDNMAEAVADVLKYVAKATASAIKQENAKE